MTLMILMMEKNTHLWEGAPSPEVNSLRIFLKSEVEIVYDCHLFDSLGANFIRSLDCLQVLYTTTMSCY